MTESKEREPVESVKPGISVSFGSGHFLEKIHKGPELSASPLEESISLPHQLFQATGIELEGIDIPDHVTETEVLIERPLVSCDRTQTRRVSIFPPSLDQTVIPGNPMKEMDAGTSREKTR